MFRSHYFVVKKTYPSGVKPQ